MHIAVSHKVAQIQQANVNHYAMAAYRKILDSYGV